MQVYVIILIIIAAVILFLASVLLANKIVSNNVYGRRGDASISIKYPLPSDFQNLDIKKDYFLNNKKARISVYQYKKKNTEPVAVVLLSHGIGGGHFYLLPLINYLCQRGLLVVAFDHYASGTSEGKKIESMTQGAIDVKYAVEYIEKNFVNLPFYVLGHSWGGFTASQALRYSNKIEKCVDIAGLDSEAAMTSGPAWFFVKLAGLLVYGKYGLYSTTGIFKKTHAEVLYLQGKQDLAVNPKKTGFKYQKKFKNRRNIHVVMLDNKGHAPIVEYSSQVRQNNVMRQFGLLGGVLVPLEVYVDFSKNNIPDMNVYKMIGDFLLN